MKGYFRLHLHLLPVIALLATLAGTQLYGQTSNTHLHAESIVLQAPATGSLGEHGFTTTDGQFFGCGSAWAEQVDYAGMVERTRLTRPEEYAKMVAFANEKGAGIRRGLSGAGAEWQVSDRDNPGTFLTINATPRYSNDSIIIWVDDRDNARITDETINLLAEGLVRKVKSGVNTRNDKLGVLFNDIEIFGRTPDDNRKWGEEFIVSFLLTDIVEPSNLPRGSIQGYFSPWDQTNNFGSNQTNVLYIDNTEALANQSVTEIDGLIGTMAHELQHLISHRQYSSQGNDYSTHWIYNEGLSEVASLRNGYFDRNANSYLGSHDSYSFFSQPESDASSTDILRAYERGMLWVHYLSQRFGDEFLGALITKGGRGLAPTRSAMLISGLGTNVEQIYADFWVANVGQGIANFDTEERPEYRYWFPVSSTVPKRDYFLTLPTGEIQKEASLKDYGAYLFTYRNLSIESRSLRVTFDEIDFDAYVYVFKSEDMNGTTTVEEIDPSQPYHVGRFSEVTFLVVNTTSREEAISWSVGPATLGVEDYSTDLATFGFSSLTPNPARDQARIDFRTSTPGNVSLDLYDVRGSLVNRLLDAEGYEIGNHSVLLDASNLQPGVYTARLTGSSGEVAVRQLVIIR